MNRVKPLVTLLALGLLIPSLRGDFYSKVPEFNPGDSGPGYDLFKPPWYPYDITEAEKYTVDEAGEMVERPEEDQGLENYGQKKPDKEAEVLRTIRKASQKLVFEKVIGSPRVVVWDFYGHVPWLAFDLPPNSYNTGFVLMGGNVMEFGSGRPPIPGDFRLLYDAWTVGLCTGWNYNISGSGWVYPKVWKGRLVPNLREFAIFLTTQGLATAKHAAVLVERDVKKEFFNPGVAALKAMSGKDFGTNPGKWRTEFVDKAWSAKHPLVNEDYTAWEPCMTTLVMQDLTAKRYPCKSAFFRLRDVPELSEPLMTQLIESGAASDVQKRNMAVLLGSFTTPRAAKALHTLARDKDTITAIRAVDSLARHPHGRVRQILNDWVDKDADDVRRAKAIVMMGRTGDAQIGNRLMALYPEARDMFEKELILRSLMRMAWKPAKPLFEENLKSDYETLAQCCRIGLFALGELSEGKVMRMLDDSFYREDAIPASGKAVSFAPLLRLDLIKYMARTDLEKPRRRLWNYIRNFKDLGEGSEVGGVAHILAYGLSEIVLGDEIISQSEASKVLEIMVNKSSFDMQLRIAALARLYSVDKKSALKISEKIVDRFLKGRKVGEAAGNAFVVTELDLLMACLNLLMIDDPEAHGRVIKILDNPNFDGALKSLLLESLYKHNRKAALKVIKDNLKYYTSRTNLSAGDTRYLVRLMRFSGLFKDAKVMKDLLKILVKSSDPWYRFMALYSLRLGLETDLYGNVITGSSQDRSRLEEQFSAKIKSLK